MANLRLEILADYDWRLGEIATLKSLPFRYHLKNSDKEAHFKYSIPAIYAIWEGFIINSFTVLIREINREELTIDQVSDKLVCYSVDNDSSLALNRARTDFRSRELFVHNFIAFIKEPFQIPSSVETKSNVNFKVISQLLEKFNLKSLCSRQYESRLNKMVFFRNAVAHGDNSIPVDKEIFEDICRTVVDAMTAIAENVITGWENKAYMKP